MSVQGLAMLAVARDAGQPKTAKRKAVHLATQDSVDTGRAPATLATTGDALVAAIPTEPLALYTGLTAAITALFATDVARSEQYLPLRWTIFAVSIVVVAVWVVGDYYSQRVKPAKDKAVRRIPVPEVLTSGAFAAWALVMPGSPLRSEVSGTTATVVTLCITFGGATFVFLMAHLGLTKPSNIAPTTTA